MYPTTQQSQWDIVFDNNNNPLWLDVYTRNTVPITPQEVELNKHLIASAWDAHQKALVQQQQQQFTYHQPVQQTGGVSNFYNNTGVITTSTISNSQTTSGVENDRFGTTRAVVQEQEVNTPPRVV